MPRRGLRGDVEHLRAEGREHREHALQAGADQASALPHARNAGEGRSYSTEAAQAEHRRLGQRPGLLGVAGGDHVQRLAQPLAGQQRRADGMLEELVDEGWASWTRSPQHVGPAIRAGCARSLW